MESLLSPTSEQIAEAGNALILAMEKVEPVVILKEDCGLLVVRFRSISWLIDPEPQVGTCRHQYTKICPEGHPLEVGAMTMNQLSKDILKATNKRGTL